VEANVSTPTTPIKAGPSGAARYRNYPAITLGTILCSQFMIGLDATVLNIALPQIREALGFSPTGLAWVTSAYMLSFSGLLLLGGRAGDIVGRRRTFMAGLALFAVASLFGGFATSPGWLIAARVAQGIGAAFAAPSSLALITTNFEEGPRRTRALGAVAGSYAASLVLGLIAGGMLVTWASWRWVMFVNVPVVAVVLILAPLFISDAARHRARFDLAGALLSIGAMTSLVYGFLHAASAGWNNSVTLIAIVAAAVLFTGYFVVEIRAEQPITPLHLFASRNRSAAFLILFLLVGPMAAMNFFLTQLLQNILSYSALSAGFAFLPMAAGLMAAAGLAAQLLNRVGHVPVIAAGAALVIVGMVWLSQVSLTTTYAGGILGPVVLFGMGVGIAMTALNELILAGVTPHESGAASSLLESMQWVGTLLGLSVLVTIFGTASRSAAENLPAGLSPQQAANYVQVQGMSMVFVASVFFSVGALLVTFIRVRVPRPAVAATDGVAGTAAAEASA
jgi:EmrB/QacA subfamily drug resistance transporter